MTDAGHFFGYPVAYMGVPDGRSFVCGIDFGSIGLGLGLAMGAAVARPERHTILFIGDGGLLMSLGELETAVRYQLPILIVVMNDAAYGSELQILRLVGAVRDALRLPGYRLRGRRRGRRGSEHRHAVVGGPGRHRWSADMGRGPGGPGLHDHT